MLKIAFIENATQKTDFWEVLLNQTYGILAEGREHSGLVITPWVTQIKCAKVIKIVSEDW